ncbi:hypothetical protein [Trichocoleus sp. DQ-U1]|uniref:hypothetical protein n=1 Tax=Trichocoleus sp. DQ-U1 TaxID=2933926 RepID=UPI0032990320
MPCREKTPLTSPPKKAKWNRDELKEMKAIIDGLLQAMEPIPEPIEEAAFPNQGRGRNGSIGYLEEKIINGCGPYRYLRYWRAGKRKSVYVGKVESPCN